MGKLTKAQRKFLTELAGFKTAIGYSVDVLSGPETAMCRRLQAGGLVERKFYLPNTNTYWHITDAGRAALKSGAPDA